MSDPPNPSDDEDRPWEQPGAVRADCVPHRGGFLLTLGLAGLICSEAGVVCCVLLPVTTPIAVGLGLTAWLLGRHDLREMDAGRMDPEGQAATRDGLKRGRQAVFNTAVALVGWGTLLALVALGRAAPRGTMP